MTNSHSNPARTRHPATRWTIVRSAARGDVAARSAFASTYLAIVRAFLSHRWNGTPAMTHVEDAVQEVFCDILRDDGVLERVDLERTRSFRSLLFGVTRNIALRHESAAARERGRVCRLEEESVAANDTETASRFFDREWALQMLANARVHMESRARTTRQQQRIELLRLRYSDGLPIREIARRFQVDGAYLHHEHATARREFRDALRAVLSDYVDAENIDRECGELLGLLAS